MIPENNSKPVFILNKGVPGVTVIPSSTSNSSITPLTGEGMGMDVYEISKSLLKKKQRKDDYPNIS